VGTRSQELPAGQKRKEKKKSNPPPKILLVGHTKLFRRDRFFRLQGHMGNI
jgi:hypothetical protein